MALLRRDLLLATRLSLSEARARLVAAVRTPADGDAALDATLHGWIEGWDFEVSPGGASGRQGFVAARGRLIDEGGETRIALVLLPGRPVLLVLVLGLLVLSVLAGIAAVLSIVTSARRGLPWMGALGILLPGLCGLGWLSLWDVGFQRAAGRTRELFEGLFDARAVEALGGA